MLKRLASLLLVSFVAACGGGGGSSGASPFGTGSGSTGGATGGGGTDTTAGTPTVVVSISSTTVSAAAPAKVQATVRDAAGAPLAGQVVSFSTSGGLGSFNVATALTDATGSASVQLSPAAPTSNGADLVVATASVNGSTVSGTIGFQVSATSTPPVGIPSISISLSSTSVTAALPATVSAVVKDAAGNPLPNQVVKFSSIDPLGTFNPPSALTDANGGVSVKLSPATATTNGAALAVAQTTIAGTQVTATAGFTVSSAGAPAAGTPSIALTLSNSVVTTSAPVTATAVIKDGTGAVVAGQVVKFATIDGLGTFAANTALTDAMGTASVVLTAAGAGTSGADQVLATATVNGVALQASQGFQLTATSATISNFTSDLATLGPYAQTNLTVSVSGAPTGTPVNLAVTSACVAKGKATLVPATATTTTGVATFTYRDGGCGATDTADALQASIVGTSTIRSLSIVLTPPTISSITFTSATPTTIYLKGSGLTETSTLVFTVVDTAGNGVPDQNVTLELLTAAGGLTLDGNPDPTFTPPKKTDSLGRVTALVNSGTVPTPVRVKATLGGISTVSSGLAVAVGLPSELNFSLSQGKLNIEGYDIDGTPNTYSIIASDRLANPVPTGTAINFIAEGGQVEPIKTTALVNGLARTTANFVSASPRPLDGRVTVVAYALGEESFLDTDGNNIWNVPQDSEFQDLGSVFLSRKFLKTYFAATDQLIPLAIPGVGSTSPCTVSSSPLLSLDVSIPTVGGSTCDGGWGRAYVRRAVETVFSTSVARPLWNTPPALLYADPGFSCPSVKDVASTPGTPQDLIVGYQEGTGAEIRSPFYRLGGTTTLYGLPPGPGTRVISFLVADGNPVRMNPVAAGSSITVTASKGLTATVEGGSPVPSSSSATFVTLSLSFDATTTSGTFTLHITAPSGLVTDIVQAVSTGTTPVVGSTSCM